MGLLELPAELRISIYEFLPDLAYGRTETIGPSVRLTPAICRVCRMLREEALPIYAKTSSFVIHVEPSPKNRAQIWLQALGDRALNEVQDLHLSRDWNLGKPSRGQGHVGFYLRLQQISQTWRCTTGTYPTAHDIRGMRLESVELLHETVMQRLRHPSASGGEIGLSRLDIQFLVEAMGVVATHPISSFDTEQTENGRKRRHAIWARMKGGLLALGQPDSGASPSLFFTPY